MKKTVFKKQVEKVPPNLKKEDIQCPICWSVLIEPVSFPCEHSVCLACFQNHIKDSLYCPCCRLRLSVWSRKAFKENNLVNNHLWEEIKIKFGHLVERRLSGDSNSQDDFSNPESPEKKRDCEMVKERGELLQQFQLILKPHLDDIENNQRIESNASVEFIRNIQEKEKQELEEEEARIKADFEIAKKLQEEERARRASLFQDTKSVESHEKRPICRNLVSEWSKGKGTSTPPSKGAKGPLMRMKGKAQPTIMKFLSHLDSDATLPSSFVSVGKGDSSTKGLERFERKDNDGTPDSINIEVNSHFRPICSAPKTPPKRLPDGTFLPEPRLVKSTAIRLRPNERLSLPNLSSVPTESFRFVEDGKDLNGTSMVEKNGEGESSKDEEASNEEGTNEGLLMTEAHEKNSSPGSPRPGSSHQIIFEDEDEFQMEREYLEKLEQERRDKEFAEKLHDSLNGKKRQRSEKWNFLKTPPSPKRKKNYPTRARKTK